MTRRKQTRQAFLLALLASAGACAGHDGAPPAAAASTTPSLVAIGTEPFWSARVEGARLTYSTPDDPAGTVITVTRRGEGVAATYSGALADQPFALEIAPGPCSDGMSDHVYPLHAVRTIGADRKDGCAAPLDQTDPPGRPDS